MGTSSLAVVSEECIQENTYILAVGGASDRAKGTKSSTWLVFGEGQSE